MTGITSPYRGLSFKAQMFTILFLCFLLSFGLNREDISNTQESNHIRKHLEVRQKYMYSVAAGRIFNSLLRVWQCGQA